MSRKKRTSLDSILPPAKPVKDQSQKQEPAPSANTAAQAKPPARKQLALHLEYPVYQQLRTLAFEEETKMHRLNMEALDRLFADRGLPSIAELTGGAD